MQLLLGGLFRHLLIYHPNGGTKVGADVSTAALKDEQRFILRKFARIIRYQSIQFPDKNTYGGNFAHS